MSIIFLVGQFEVVVSLTPNYFIGTNEIYLAEAEDCNITILLAARHCCNTDYCNHAMGRISISWFMMLMTIVVIVKG